MARLKRLPDRLGALPDRVKPAPKVALPFYGSPEWLALMRRLKSERGNWCEVCGRGGRIYGDHVVEIRDGGAMLDPRNVHLLCHGCHQAKTEREKARRVGLYV